MGAQRLFVANEGNPVDFDGVSLLSSGQRCLPGVCFRSSTENVKLYVPTLTR